MSQRSVLTAPNSGDSQMSRTVPVDGDSHFTKLDAEVNALMAKWGFARKEHEGSTSWVATPKYPSSCWPGRRCSS